MQERDWLMAEEMALHEQPGHASNVGEDPGRSPKSTLTLG